MTEHAKSHKNVSYGQGDQSVDASGEPLPQRSIESTAEGVAVTLGAYLCHRIAQSRPGGELKDIAIAYGVAVDKLVALRHPPL